MLKGGERSVGRLGLNMKSCRDGPCDGLHGEMGFFFNINFSV